MKVNQAFSGYSYGYGSGSGYVDGSGDGSGNGAGSGDGSGSDSGYASGYGDGDAYASGSGYGYGDGYLIATGIEEHPTAYLLLPWAWLRIGCQALPLEEWRERWEELAENEGVEVTQEQADAIFAVADAARASL